MTTNQFKNQKSKDLSQQSKSDKNKSMSVKSDVERIHLEQESERKEIEATRLRNEW